MAVLHQNLTAMVSQYSRMLELVNEHAVILSSPWIATKESSSLVTSSAEILSSAEGSSSAASTSESESLISSQITSKGELR